MRKEKKYIYIEEGILTIPKNITIHGIKFKSNQITKFAFRGLMLEEIIIPDSVTDIGFKAFSYNAFTSVTFKRRDITGDSYDDNAFAEVYSKPTLYIPAGAVGYPKPSTTPVRWLGTTWSSVVELEDEKNPEDTSMTIGANVTSIGDEAFEANNLTSVTISDSVTDIGDSAFFWNKLTSLIIPESVIRIGFSAFANNSLRSLTIGSKVKVIGEFAFASNYLTCVTIPESVTSIGDSAFRDNELTIVIIPDSVTTIGKKAFAYNSLTCVTIPESVTSIGKFAFEKNDLTSVTFKRRDITGAYYDDSAFEYDDCCDEDIYSNPTLYIPAGAVGYPEPSTTPVVWLGTLWSSVIEIEE